MIIIHKRIMSSLLLCLLLFSIPIHAQKKSDFNIPLSTKPIEGARYNKLKFIAPQSFLDNENLGLTSINMWGSPQYVTLSTPIDLQFNSLVQSMGASLTEDRTLALQMRVLFFTVGMNNDDNRGKALCNIRVTLYEVDDNDADRYYFLSTLDTLVVNKAKNIKKEVANAITTFIADNIVMSAMADEPAITMDEVGDIETFERFGTPFYTDSILPDGVYTTYKSLKNLSPDVRGINMRYDEESKDIVIVGPKKENKLEAKIAYGVVIDGVPYIKFENKFYRAYKKNDDWCFAYTQKIAGSGFTLNFGFGVGVNSRVGVGSGVGIPIGVKSENIEMYIDHLNGDVFWGDRINKKK